MPTQIGAGHPIKVTYKCLNLMMQTQTNVTIPQNFDYVWSQKANSK